MRKFGRYLLPAFLAAISLTPSLASARDVRIVALYAPSLDFQDGSRRNAFVAQIARHLSERTGWEWEGRSFARAADFELELGNIDAAVLDAEYFTGKTGGLLPVAMLEADGRTSRPLKVVARKGGSEVFSKYRGKRLAVAGAGSPWKSFVTSSVLGHEAKAADYFSSVDEVRDVRSAINAVQMGKADLTLTFEGYDDGLVTLYTTPPVGLPVIAVNPVRVSGDDAKSVSDALKGYRGGASFITGAAGYSESDAMRYRKLAGASRYMPSYQPVEGGEQVELKVPRPCISDRTGNIAVDPNLVSFAPAISDIDVRLDGRL